MAPLPVTLTDLQSVSFVAHFPYLASHNMCSYEQTLLVALIVYVTLMYCIHHLYLSKDFY